MQYFALSKQHREAQFLSGRPNPIYTEVFPNEDFAPSGYWFWLKSPVAHGFDVKAFNEKYVYLRSTELEWKDNATFKRFVHDLPISARCVSVNAPGLTIHVPDTRFQYFASCKPYKASTVGTAVNDIEAPIVMDSRGKIGHVTTRVLHYRYNCDKDYQNCRDEEQFFLGRGYGLWKWEHLKAGVMVKTSVMNDITSGSTKAGLSCTNSYQ